jgi:hypothetical protein
MLFRLFCQTVKSGASSFRHPVFIPCNPRSAQGRLAKNFTLHTGNSAIKQNCFKMRLNVILLLIFGLLFTISIRVNAGYAAAA